MTSQLSREGLGGDLKEGMCVQNVGTLNSTDKGTIFS